MRCPECDAVLLPGEPTREGICSDCAGTDPLVECPVCGCLGLPERIRDHNCGESPWDEPFIPIAPRDDDLPPITVVGEMLADVHTHATWLRYHDLWLHKISSDGGENVWDIHRGGRTVPIEVLNCAAFKTATGLDAYLDDLRMLG
jgi:hypothetical protein